MEVVKERERACEEEDASEVGICQNRERAWEWKRREKQSLQIKIVSEKKSQHKKEKKKKQQQKRLEGINRMEIEVEKME